MNAKERSQVDEMIDRFMTSRNKKLSTMLLKAEKEEISRLKTNIEANGKIQGRKLA